MTSWQKFSALKTSTAEGVIVIINGKRSAEYTAWSNMKTRCYNENVSPESFKYWGGKGVKVCRRWLKGQNGKKGFACFLEDVGRRPSAAHTIDRYPNARGDYKPGNVRWATWKEQGWSKLGKPRPDLAAFNRSRTGVPLTKAHKAKIKLGFKRSRR